MNIYDSQAIDKTSASRKSTRASELEKLCIYRFQTPISFDVWIDIDEFYPYNMACWLLGYTYVHTTQFPFDIMTYYVHKLPPNTYN